MDIKDIKKAGVSNAKNIDIKELEVRQKNKKIKFEEIKVNREGNQKSFLEKLKNFFSKFWFLVWKDDSPKGWIISILFLFVFIKLIFFPTISLIAGTSLPLAIVESCSMYHDGNLLSDYDAWWDAHESKYSKYDISKDEFENFIFKNGFNKGDILVLVGAKPEKLAVGDVIVFNAQQRNPVIHRIISVKKQGEEYVFATIGDNNNGQLSFEKSINQNQIVGRAVLKIAPYAGWGKLILYEWKRPNSERGLCSQS